MRPMIRLAATVLGALALAILAAACGGSATDKASPSPAPKWEKVLTTQISGAQPVKLNLGIYDLGARVRVGWVLSGPERPPVKLTFRIFNVEEGMNYGQTVSPLSGAGVNLVDEEAMVVGPIWPGKYRIFFTQRFRPKGGPGYDVQLTVSTLR
jgi:hypothetical protein